MPVSKREQCAQAMSARLMRPPFEAARPFIEAGIASGHVRIRHPVLFDGLLHHTLNRRRAAASILNTLAPIIDPADVDCLRAESLITACLDPSPPGSGVGAFDAEASQHRARPQA